MGALKDGNDTTVLHIAQNVEVFEFLAMLAPEYLLSKTKTGQYPLHFAAKLGNVDIASSILDKLPESLFMADIEGTLPIHLALANGTSNMIDLLSPLDKSIEK